MDNSVRMLEFPQRGDERGYLVVAEGGGVKIYLSI